jgi:hypothetical protein
LSSFILRILFSGLMAFVPNEDGTEVTVLLLNTGHAYHTSDGAALPPHKPLLLARAGNCTGTCPKREAAIAEAMFSDSSATAAADALEAALDDGGGWILAGSDISIRKGSTNDPDLPALSIRSGVRTDIVPTTSAEREDFSWVANLQQLCSSGCSLDSDVLGSAPPGLIAARIHLTSGNVFTYTVARIGADVTPVHFKRLDGTGSTSSYTQAVASMVGVDIEVEGDSIEIAEESFDNIAGRTMRLEPDTNGKVEVAVLNLPPFIPPASPDNEAPEVGKHFEAYYELLQNPPARETRLVPRAGVASGTYPQVGWQSVHPSSALGSDLLNALRLNAGRSMYDRVLCPPASIPLP